MTSSTRDGSTRDHRLIGLSGGIGAGKSTIAERLAAAGATIVDGDAVARAIMEPGGAALAPTVATFGEAIVGPDGRLDRTQLASIVFAEPERLVALTAITAPLIDAECRRLIAAAPSGSVVVHDYPLLVEDALNGTYAFDYDLIVIVLAGVETRLDRLVGRGLERSDAMARMDRQATDDQRREVADVIIDNEASLDDPATDRALNLAIDDVLARLARR